MTVASRIAFSLSQRATRTAISCNLISKKSLVGMGFSLRTHSSAMSLSVDADYQSPVIEKMKTILDDYREKNFSHTLFSRFAKEILATADVDGDGKISTNELQIFLKNIGAENSLSEEDIDDLMNEFGESDGSECFVYVDDVYSMMH